MLHLIRLDSAPGWQGWAILGTAASTTSDHASLQGTSGAWYIPDVSLVRFARESNRTAAVWPLLVAGASLVLAPPYLWLDKFSE